MREKEGVIAFMRASIRRIGNSRGIIIPQPMLAQIGLANEADIAVENDAIVLRKPQGRLRQGWAVASRELAQTGEDALVWPEFKNEDDGELVW